MTIDPIQQLRAQRALMLADAIFGHLTGNDPVETLVELRKREGFTVEEVAEALNCSVESVVEFERPGADPALSMVRRYAMAVGARVRVVMADIGEPL